MSGCCPLVRARERVRVVEARVLELKRESVAQSVRVPILVALAE